MQPPDAAWLEFIKVSFGPLALVILSVLAALIALGRVEQATSHGLMPLVTALSMLATQWAQWAFRKKD